MWARLSEWAAQQIDLIQGNVSGLPLPQIATLVFLSGAIAQVVEILLKLSAKKAYRNGFPHVAFLTVITGVAAVAVLRIGEAVLDFLGVHAPFVISALGPPALGAVFAALALTQVWGRDSFTWPRFIRVGATPLVVGGLLSASGPIRQITQALINNFT